MTKDEYRSILGRLPIKSPTAEDMAMLCPHLTKAEAVKAFTTGSGYVACPSLFVKHAYHVVSYHAESVEQIKERRGDTQIIVRTKNHPACLHYGFTQRTIKSYADGKRRGDVFGDYVGMQQAMQFAEDSWGSDLVLDDWVSAVKIYVQDPTDLFNDLYHKDQPRTKAVLYVTLKRDWSTIHQDQSRPTSELLDNIISQMTLDRMIFDELIGGRGGGIEFSCAHCGFGLGLSGCDGCGYRFKDNYFRCGGRTPLAAAVAA